MIPPQASPTTVGVSPHRVQANHLVAGLETFIVVSALCFCFSCCLVLL